ncbi:MAG: alpha/beta hydrolase [Gammaproteobacteria bacterium]|nr:alpha/beta hydrolase [Gammaproteobacteria bacterium]
MRIYFGTNRDPDDPQRPSGFGTRFSRQGLTDLRFGWADFAAGQTRDYALYVAAEKLAVEPQRAAVGDLSAQVLGSREVFEQTRRELVERGCDCVIYIHGFDVTFADALRRTAELQAFYAGRPMVWCVFSWPSDGSLLPFKAYASDRDDARASGVALGRGLLKLADFLRATSPADYCSGGLHVLAHSMGVYALRWALQAIRTQTPSLRRLFDQILLFGADEDDDAFECDHKLALLPDLARRVSVYVNPGDLALVTSELTKGNPDRLGAGGPRNARALPDKVSVIDVERIEDFAQDPTGHQYYRLLQPVRGDALAVFAGAPAGDIPGREYLPERRAFGLLPAAPPKRRRVKA